MLIDKPAGRTSHDVVATARRALGIARIGHAGTLDPFATGLLVLLIGRATRLLPYLEGEPKVYDATIRFGFETDTDDATGEATRRAALPPGQAVADGMRQLTGALEQSPPAYSAKKVSGRRAYAAARRGRPIALKPATIAVHSWRTVHETAEDLRVIVVCSSGTYVRALARDLGRLADSAAHLAALRRLASGPFTVEQADTIDDLKAGVARLHPLQAGIPSMPATQLNADGIRRLTRGQPVSATTEAARVALLDHDDALVAIGQREGDVIRPVLVFRDA